MERIKILEVIRQGEIGGGESHVIDLINGFPDDIEPIVVAFTNGHMIEVLRERNIKCYVVESRLPFDITIQKRVAKIIRKEKVKIIHAHGTKAASSMILPSFFTKIPLIYTVHGWSFHQNICYFINVLRILSEKIICSFCKQVICVSDDNKQLGIKKFNLSPNTIVIENGINLDKFNPNIENKNIRNEFNFKKDDFIICFIGRITQQKSPYDFIESVALANNKNNKIKGLMIGDGDLKKQIETYVKNKSYDNVIKLDHFRNDIPDILKSVNVFSLLSLWEGLSISLLEAMAMKKAIVITPTDGSREIMENHVNGIVVPFNKPELAAEAYLELMNNKEELEQFIEKSYKLVKERFCSSRVSNSVANIYKEIVLIHKQ